MKNNQKKNIFKSVDDLVNNTAIAIDDSGSVVLENFRKVIDYTSEKLVMETNRKVIYIYGENLIILSCDKHNATAKGNIAKIEIFPKEV